MTIMYVCNACEMSYPEDCGRYCHTELRVLPDGTWICESCYDELPPPDRADMGLRDDAEWSSLKPPPEYVPGREITPMIDSQPISWVILRKPGCVPERKGPFRGVDQIKGFLIEAFDHRPDALATVLTVCSDGDLSVEDGPQWLEIADGRQRYRADRHRASTRAAFSAKCEGMPAA